VDLDAVEIRVLGCMIEKQQTTPDVYPLSLNALRTACNQTTNRYPVVSYDEGTIRAALQRLSQRQLARLASGPGSRAVKYRHLLSEALNVSGEQLAVLCVLMLRGAQTLGELKARTERMQSFASLAEVHGTVDELVGRELVARLPRRPGQKEERYVQLLGGDSSAAPPPGERLAGFGDDTLEARLSRLEDEVAELRHALEGLKAHGGDPDVA
jgi:uncharacterized protein YceH (UPF0502 family)